MKVGTLLLRTTIGGFFVGHGAQKLFGVAGGHGLRGTAQFFERLGLRPGLAQATAAGIAETGGGAGLVLGYRTQLSASAVVASMAVAIHRVHGKNGWNIQDGGFEYNAVLIAGALAIAETGPGFLSLDALRGKNRHGLIPAAFTLAAGLGGAAAASAASGYFGGSTTGAPTGGEDGAGKASNTPSGDAPAGAGEAPHGGALSGTAGEPTGSGLGDADGGDLVTEVDGADAPAAFTAPASVEPVAGTGSETLLPEPLADAGVADAPDATSDGETGGAAA